MASSYARQWHPRTICSPIEPGHDKLVQGGIFCIPRLCISERLLLSCSAGDNFDPVLLGLILGRLWT